MEKRIIATLAVLISLASFFIVLTVHYHNEYLNVKDQLETLREAVQQTEYWREGYYQHHIFQSEKATVHVIYDIYYDEQKEGTVLRWIAFIQNTHDKTFRIKVGFGLSSGEEVGETWYEVEAGLTRWVSDEVTVSGADLDVESVYISILTAS